MYTHLNEKLSALLEALQDEGVSSLLEAEDGKKRLSQARYDKRFQGINAKLNAARQAGRQDSIQYWSDKLKSFQANYRPPLANRASVAKKDQPATSKAAPSATPTATPAAAPAPAPAAAPASSAATPKERESSAAVKADKEKEKEAKKAQKEMDAAIAKAIKKAEKEEKAAEKAKQLADEKAKKAADKALKDADKKKAKEDAKKAKEDAKKAQEAANKAAEEAELEQNKKDILDKLSKGGLSSADLALKLKKKGRGVRQAISDLEDEGKIIKTPKGWEVVKEPDDIPAEPPPPEVDDVKQSRPATQAADGRFLVGPAFGHSNVIPRPESEVDKNVKRLKDTGASFEVIDNYMKSVEAIPDEDWANNDYRIRVNPKDWRDDAHNGEHFVRDPEAPRATEVAAELAAARVGSGAGAPPPGGGSKSSAPDSILSKIAKGGKRIMGAVRGVGKMIYDAQVQKLRQRRWNNMVTNMGKQASTIAKVLTPFIGPDKAAVYSADWTLKLNKAKLDDFDKLGYVWASPHNRGDLIEPAKADYLKKQAEAAKLQKQRRIKHARKLTRGQHHRKHKHKSFTTRSL